MSVQSEKKALNICVLTISDTRSEKDDSSGDLLINRLKDAEHKLYERNIVKDDVYQIRARLSHWIADKSVQVVITTGGTGFSGRDSTPEAVEVLFDKTIEGFGELFRQVSYDEIGSSTIQSRALAGLANATAIFCLPGSNNACKTAWDKILNEQLDSTYRPCNFVGQLGAKAN